MVCRRNIEKDISLICDQEDEWKSRKNPPTLMELYMYHLRGFHADFCLAMISKNDEFKDKFFTNAVEHLDQAKRCYARMNQSYQPSERLPWG